jgi:serine/threonine-protein kinase
VYIARDTRTGFNRAVKVLGSGHGRDSEFMQRFIAEGTAARLCAHPNIVTTYEADQADGVAYIAMEQLQGETLKVLLELGKIQTTFERVNIAWQVAQAVAYLHQRDIIHRDVKLENISVGPTGHAKIFDFGVAKMNRQKITKEGQILGTPLYMSPEQVRGDQVTHATDIYSYGVVLFVLFSEGAFPYQAVSREDLYAAIVFHPPDLTPLDGKMIPGAVAGLIVQCLEKQPAARPRSFVAIEEILRPLAVSPDVTALVRVPAARAKKSPPRRARGWILPMLLSFALAAAAAGAGFLWMTRVPDQPEARISTNTGFMVLVPAGPTYAGKDHHPVDAVASFYIDRAEASNDHYREFARSTGHQLPEGEATLPASFPVVNVSYDDASAFCSWAGKRLPTAIEWEKAARGPQGSVYPWGDQYRSDFANIPHPNEPHELEPVESNLVGASGYGAINLLGNVWEWVATPETLEENDVRGFALDPPAQVGEPAYQIRGGSFLQIVPLNDAAWDFAVAPARVKRADIGFRCAR